MFERYTEQARRTIFFARYEASIFGSSHIETEHLLLGILREGKVLTTSMSIAAKEDIRQQVEQLSERREKISTSVDLPLSHDCKKALTFGAEESESMGHSVIDSGHLVLGLLRLEFSQAAQLLRKHGIELQSYREVVRKSVPVGRPPVGAVWMRPVERESAWEQHEPPEARAPSLRTTVTALQSLVDRMVKNLETYSETYGLDRLKRKPWSRKEAFGHLVDWASAHHHWFARAVSEGRLVAGGYPEDGWVTIQRYQDFSWPEIVDAWITLNRVLVHALIQIPEEKVNSLCRIGLAEPIPLSKLAADYVEHCEDIAGQILARLV
jgi:Clp amino terminal domain, pathogenicity island component